MLLSQLAVRLAKAIGSHVVTSARRESILLRQI